MLGMETMFDNSKKLLTYLTRLYKYNSFIIDNIDDELVKELSKAIRENDRIKAVRLYLKIDSLIDALRDERCSNKSYLQYRSNFRNIAKDMYRELKMTGLCYNEDLKVVARILQFISTSDYYIIREFLIKRSHAFYCYLDIPLNPEDFYCGYIPLEAVLDYCIKLVNISIKA
jgi:hypothetical protein